MNIVEYIPVGMLVVVALGMGLMFTLLGILLGPKNATPTKKMPFESGLVNKGSGYERYNVRFYMVALAFLIFDVEVIFFYPWAVKFREYGWYGFSVMMIFFFVLILGLAYDWKKGALEWE